MTLVASTVAGLGVPSQDGEAGIVRVGVGADFLDEVVYWHQAQQAWAGRPRWSMRMVDAWGMAAFGPPNTWLYPASTDGLGGVDTGYGFQIQPVTHAKALADAGLKLQEHLSAAAAADADGVTAKLGLCWYEMDAGDTFLSPVPSNFGVALDLGGDSIARRHASTGWQNSPAALAAKEVWYPELYARSTNGTVRFRHFSAMHRWVAGNVGALGGADASNDRPPTEKLYSWLVADKIPLADGASVAEWPDASGIGRHLQQSVAANRPVLVRNAWNGRAVVRFDGANDYLRTLVGDIVAPYTIFVVLKQYGGGPTQQVWMENGSAAAPLIYRSGAGGETSYWLGTGGDVTYVHAGGWPSTPMVVSVTATVAASDIWENKTLKASGSAGSAGPVGMTLGAAFDGSLPAQIDVAEVLVVYGALSDAARGALVDWLNARYALF